ncbi:hypothetical protein [Polyangium jinanense]|uniref:Uncharacterized protein n=1 Tax=Polyangium jinanense TaxID=2829994 RepID=A0A9X3XEH6_9BACT|nr:hypothetical protein [Polyangium jinanense]MDC3988707.1 hypothetical protein [Polyangium jinanense]
MLAAAARAGSPGYAAAQHIAATDDAYDYAAHVRMGETPFNPLLLPRGSA